ncbi:hypothetical protein RIdsm_03639 [Roseovarius indicus]|uniref:Uncharacterized protein n=1 Tax=Roseovarius indicus TaxID=540747 RepID=A0A0T5P3F8_9RHOB|nr:hypothetical protein [Roseovarius indicus]KRS15667.1 hypothetical protein XM52_22790 [Roseovarius indicus]QEW27819.1 hypothetical protein RIdsm_03639 [Roseovarius indicus]SFE79934.1 hypothetical protein SAMN04488031_12249 [Roseovarius indicus]
MIAQLASALGVSRGIVLAGVVAGMLALAATGAAWLRSDAVRDHEAREAVEGAQGRLQTLEEGDRRRNDVDAMDDDSLRDVLLDWLR